ncbi:MAG: GAF domain-containing protein [Fidelibacterota bacterium]
MTQPLVLCDVATLLSPSVSREDIFNSLFNLVNKMIPFSSATLYALAGSEKTLVTVFQHGDEPVDLASSFRFQNGHGIAGWISTQSYPIIFPSLKSTKWSERSTFNSMVSIPLHYNQTPIGVLNLGHVEKNTYQACYREDYQYLGRQVSLILMHLIREKNIMKQQDAQEQSSWNPPVSPSFRRQINIILELIDLLTLSLPTGNLERISVGMEAIKAELLKMSQRMERDVPARQSTASSPHLHP